jgi:hypothetical protein
MIATAQDSRLAERFPEGEGWQKLGPFRVPTPPPNTDRSQSCGCVSWLSRANCGNARIPTRNRSKVRCSPPVG